MNGASTPKCNRESGIATYLAIAFHGITLNRAELRRVLGPGLSAEDEPQPVGPVRAGIWSAIAVIALSILVTAIGALDQQIKDEPSPWKLTRLPDCEAIAGKVYKLGTWERLQALTGEALRASETGRAAYCSAVKQVRLAAAAPVDRYLDWYFSLGAELQRTLSLFSGNTDQMLQSKLKEVLDADPGFRSLVAHISSTGNASLRTADDLGGLREAILKDNVIIGDEQQCRVVRHEATLPGHQELFDLRARGATVSGLTVGVVTGAIAAKAMTKAVMKSAAKVVAKIVAKQGIKAAAGIAGGAGTGATVGSVIPGLGTVAGAVIGGVIGLATTIGVDIALLAAEEKFTREDMKRELLDAVQEGVAGSAQGIDCSRKSLEAAPPR